jgi:hypothetical protein
MCTRGEDSVQFFSFKVMQAAGRYHERRLAILLGDPEAGLMDVVQRQSTLFS